MKLSILLLLLFISFENFAQDTIRIEAPTITDRSRNRPNWNTSKELIYFSKNHVKIEDCYYYNNKRDCSGVEYQIVKDTLIIQKNEKWLFKKIDINNYEVTKIGKNHFEVGHTTSLIPFVKKGSYFGLSLSKDTLWEQKFSNHSKFGNNSDYFSFHKIKIEKKILDLKKLDSIPKFNQTQKIPNINLEFNDLLRLNGFFYVGNIPIYFIITDNGEIKNIEVNVPICNEHLKEIAIKLSLLQPLSYPIKDNENVYCRYQIEAFRKTFE